MLRLCNKCGQVHDSSIKCGVSHYKRPNDEFLKFQSRAVWKKKREQIKIRDHGMCAYCWHKMQIANTQNLSVHHITKLCEDFNKALDDDNLITLCSYHHAQADAGTINPDLLRFLASPGM